MSVVKALEHASMRCGHKLDLQVCLILTTNPGENVLKLDPVGRLR